MGSIYVFFRFALKTKIDYNEKNAIVDLIDSLKTDRDGVEKWEKSYGCSFFVS